MKHVKTNQNKFFSTTDYRLISLSYIIVAYLMIACEQAVVSYLGKRSEPRENARARGLGVLERLASLAQIGELARRLVL